MKRNFIFEELKNIEDNITPAEPQINISNNDDTNLDNTYIDDKETLDRIKVLNESK